MNFYEFLEAISRLAEIISPYPFTEYEQHSAMYNTEKLRGVPLNIKIEALIIILSKHLLPQRSDIEIPTKSLFEDDIQHIRNQKYLIPRILIKKR